MGGYNPVLGKSYGEIGAEARTMHKSQGEGRPRRRGSYFEFFQHLNGDTAKLDTMDGVVTNWSRLNAPKIQSKIQQIISAFKVDQPATIVPGLVELYQQVNRLPQSHWREYQLNLIQSAIESAAGLLVEATTTKQQVTPESDLTIQVLVNQRANLPSSLGKIELLSNQVSIIDTLVQSNLLSNQNQQFTFSFKVPASQPISQPYWLVNPKTEGMFVVQDQTMIGKAENEPAFSVLFKYTIAGYPNGNCRVINYTIRKRIR